MTGNFIKEIEVITVTLETQAGTAGNFVWSHERKKSQIRNISLFQISIWTTIGAKFMNDVFDKTWTDSTTCNL